MVLMWRLIAGGAVVTPDPANTVTEQVAVELAATPDGTGNAVGIGTPGMNRWNRDVAIAARSHRRGVHMAVLQHLLADQPEPHMKRRQPGGIQ